MISVPTADKQENSGLGSTVYRLVGSIERLSPGDRAELRRASHRDPACPSFWRLAISHELIDGKGARSEERWAVIIAAMARLEGLHRPGVRLGAALAEAGLAELRLVRLLRAEGERLYDELRAVVQALAAKGVGFDQVDLARLVLSEGQSNETSVRRRIARDYFSKIQD